MTRKDYIVLAAACKEANLSPEQVKVIANKLEQTYPNFNRPKFITACLF